jgi:signal transduction histidine kinase
MAISEQPGRVDQEQAPPAQAAPTGTPVGKGRRGKVRPRKARPARPRSIRVTLVGLLLVPLVALVGLWAFLASLTLGTAITEHNGYGVVTQVAGDARLALNAVDAERLQTFLWMSSPRRPPVSALAASRRADDVAIATYERTTGAVPGQQLVIAELRKIPGIRSAVDSGALTPAAAFDAYNAVVDGLFGGYLTTPEYDTSLYRLTLGAIDLGWALEELSREVTLVAGAEVDRGQMSAAEAVLFARAAGAQDLLAERAIVQFSGRLAASVQRLYASPLHAELAALEERIPSGRGQALSPGTLRAWRPVSGQYLGQLLAVDSSTFGPLTSLEGNDSTNLFLKAGLAGGLGLLAILASIFLMVRFGRTITRELTGLHDGAETMASERLPRVVERLRGGEDVDVAAESPPLPTGGITEIARVADAFSSVQRTAVDAAVGQANLRKGVNQVFLNLSLRNQSLLHRQLSMLDTMERAAAEPEALADLFRLDHLTTRMRRHAESLIILSGATPGRGWRDPVPVLDVLRAAVAEVEDYIRVDVVSESSDSVIGVAVNDVIHLIAELVENATTFSPPNTRVEIRADVVGIGFAVEIEDRGLGVPAEELAEINARLASPPEFDLASSDRLGLFVVGQLAARHQIRVSLRESAFGGTTAIVLLPHGVIVREGESGPSATVIAGQHAPLGVNGIPYPPAGADPVANRERASAFSPTGRHRVEAAQPDARPLPGARPQQGTPQLEAPASPRGLGSASTGHIGTGPTRTGGPGARAGSQAPPRDPLRPAPGQEPPRQRFAGNSAGWPGPASAEQPGPDHGPAAGGTHLGLPRRVRQASLAPQLRDRPEPASPAAGPGGNSSARSPDEMRTMMSSLQDGWQRGRADYLDQLDELDHLDNPHDWPGGKPGAASGNDGEVS